MKSLESVTLSQVLMIPRTIAPLKRRSSTCKQALSCHRLSQRRLKKTMTTVKIRIKLSFKALIVPLMTSSLVCAASLREAST